MTSRRLRVSDQGELFAVEPAMPGGFAYRQDVISCAEELALVARLASLPFKPFDFHGHLGNRRVVSFGWRYDYAGRTLQRSDPLPPFLLTLREAVAEFAGVPAPGLEQIFVTEYAPGAGIGWHRDKPMFEDVIAISLLAPCTLRFRRRQGNGWERASLGIGPRSAYQLRGPSRREWEHSILPLDRLRYSVTFRNFVEAAAPDRAVRDREACR